MANGSGLTGNASTTQSAIIVKKPGSSSLYYVFTLGAGGNASLNYSIVDMTLASGNGSVVTKNVLVYSSCNEKLTSVKHCNGVDIWVLYHEAPTSSNYRATLVTASGVSATAVVSTVGTSASIGQMKLSPNGKKLGSALYNSSGCELYDFDSSTGIITNALSLGTSNVGMYGCEFSPDGTKFYGSGGGAIYQWDLCAGSATAISASAYSFTSSNNWGMQLAPDGKIYIANYLNSSLHAITAPNLSGSAMSYSASYVSLSTNISRLGLPNFITSGFKPPPPPFTYTVSNSYGCQSVAFTLPATINTSTTVGCAASGYSVVGQTWIFGDPSSGAANTTTLSNPIHAYTSLGTYTAMLVFNYSCGGGTDTIKQVLIVNQPCISVSSTSITCANLGSATVVATGGVGPYSYTWMPTAQAGSVATGLSPGSYTLTVHDFGNNFTYTATTMFTSLIPLTGNLNNANSVSCNGASTATANVSNLSGGSGSVNYLWSNPSAVSYTTPTVLLGAGLWSITVTDALTGCKINQSFYIAQPSPLNLNLTTTSSTVCAGKSVTLTALNSGGVPSQLSPGYSYTWTGGSSTSTRIVTQALSGTYVYSCTSKDSNNCSITSTIGIDFISNPILITSNVFICPLATGVLTVSGASSYTWSNNSVGNSLSDNPTSSTQYTVLGSTAGCTNTSFASIILKPVPLPLINSNSPVCKGQALTLFVYGGSSYSWSGPLSYTSTLQNPVITPADTSNSGIYTATITGANSCTAAITKTILVNPTPTLSAQGSTVCNTQTLNLSANSFPGANFIWSGPGSFTSNLQNPFIVSPPVTTSGNYTVKVTSVAGCTNSAIAQVMVTAMQTPTITSNNPQCIGSALTFTGSGAGSYLWSGPMNFTSSLQNPVIPNAVVLNSGIYTLQLTLGPCVNTAAYNATVFPLPSFSLSSNAPVCETKSLSLTSGNVSNAVFFQWHGPLGFSLPGQSVGRDSCKLGYTGIYTLSITDANTCHNTATISILINQNPTLTPVSTTVCLNQSATLSVSGAVSYLWTGPGFYQSTQETASIPVAGNSVITIYTVVGTAANQCTSVVTASLSTLSLPLPVLNVSPANHVCLNKSFYLNGSGGMSYEWYGAGGVYYAGPTLSISANSILKAGTYTLIVTDEKGCKSSTLTTLVIDPLPIGELTGTKFKDCVPFCSDFKFKPSGGTASFITSSWQVDSKTYTLSSFSSCFTSAGIHTLTGILTDTIHNCVNTLKVLVEAYALPVANFTYNPALPVEDEETVFVNTSAGEDQSSWNWFFKTSLTDSSRKENPVYSYKEAGTYPVAMVVKNKWGCADSIVRFIKIDPDLTIYVPNVFTPNGDDLNETFLPVLRGIKSYNLMIFDRWGVKLYETNNVSQGWSGSYKGEPCKQDIYVWKISYSALNGTMKVITGQVLLNR